MSDHSAVPHRQNQQLRKILMQNLDTSNDDEWFAFVDILTDSITRQIRSGMVPGQVRGFLGRWSRTDTRRGLNGRHRADL